MKINGSDIEYNKNYLCCCTKDFYYKKANEYAMDIDPTELLFKNGEYYKFHFQDKECVWIIYDENGKSNKQGFKFYYDENSNTYYKHLYYFYDYFEIDRKMKLNRLNKILE